MENANGKITRVRKGRTIAGKFMAMATLAFIMAPMSQAFAATNTKFIQEVERNGLVYSQWLLTAQGGSKYDAQNNFERQIPSACPNGYYFPGSGERMTVKKENTSGRDLFAASGVVNCVGPKKQS